jgi:hypothetical protein
MIEVALFIAFITCLVVGSLIANSLGRLPTAEELEAEDQARLAQFDRDR